MSPNLSRRLLAAPLIAAALGLAACDGIQNDTDAAIAEANQRVVNAGRTYAGQRSFRAGGLQVSQDHFVAPVAERVRPQRDLPARVQAADAVILVSRDPLRLADIADRLAAATGIPHALDLGPRSGAGRDEATPLRRPGEPDMGPLSLRLSDTSAANLAIRPSLRGPLGEVLDQIAAAFDVEWSYVGSRVVFRDYVTRQYQMSILPVTSSMASGSAGISSSASVDLWGEFETGLQGVLGEGARVSVGRGTGILTVTALLADHDRLEDYLARMNATMGQQIAFDVNVLSVDVGADKGLALDLVGALDLLDGVSYAGGSQIATPMGGVNFGILNGNLALDGIITALSAQGAVALENRIGATTTNFQMVPVEILDQITYISEVSEETEEDDNGNETTTITVTAETLEVGIQLQLLPRVLNAREIMLRFGVRLNDLTALKEIDVVPSTPASMQLPEIARTSFEQQVVLGTGQTLVLAGFERTRNESRSQGIGNARFIGLGGERNAQQSRLTTVVQITPRLLARPGSTR